MKEAPNREEGPSREKPSLKEEPVVEGPNREEEPTWKGPTWDSWEVSAESVLGPAGNPPHVTGIEEAADGMSWQQPGTVAGAAKEEEGPSVPSLVLPVSEPGTSVSATTGIGCIASPPGDPYGIPQANPMEHPGFSSVSPSQVGICPQDNQNEEPADGLDCPPLPAPYLSPNAIGGAFGGPLEVPEPFSCPAAESGEEPAGDEARGVDEPGWQEDEEVILNDLLNDLVPELFSYCSGADMAAAHANLPDRLKAESQARGSIPQHKQQRILRLATSTLLERWVLKNSVRMFMRDR